MVYLYHQITLVQIKMKKTLFLLISLFLLTASKAQNKEYEILNISLIQNYSKGKCDTIDVVKKTTVIKDYFFKSYIKEKKEKENGIFSTAHMFTWINNNEKWILTENDLKYMQNIQSKSMNLKRKKINIGISICNLVNRPFLGNKSMFENNSEEFKKITKRILNCRPLYEFSTPIFNEDKTIAIILRNQILVDDFSYLIYKLKANQWKLVGYTEHSSE